MVKPKKTIKNIIPYKTDENRTNWEYKLDSNENYYKASNFVLDCLKEIKNEDVSLYPCYGRLIDKLRQRYNIQNLLLTNGIDEALSLIINTYLEKNEEILAFCPTFSMPFLYAQTIGGKIKKIDYDEKYVFNKEKLDKNIKRKTKLIYLASPNNPTGEVIKVQDIKYLIEKHKNKLFIVDCTYINFSNTYKLEDYLELIKDNDNVVVLKSFSKDFALAGLRIGFVSAQREIIESIKKVASPYNVNMIAVNCAIKVLENEDKFDFIKEKINEAKELLFKGLQNLNYIPYNSEANFILCDFKNHKDFVYQKLKNNGIIVRSFKDSSNLRITIPDVDGVKKILDLLKPRNLYVFDLDGVVFDVSNSYRLAIMKTFEHFVKENITDVDIQNVKNLGGMSNDWKVTKYLIDKAGKKVKYDDVIEVFQDLFFNPNSIQKGLIDNEKLAFDVEFFEKLSKQNSLAVFTSRPKQEAFYSLEKFGIKKYFDYFICQQDVGKFPKPSGFGLNKIKQNCIYNEIYYFGDTVDDIKAGMEAKVKAYGVIPPNASKIEETIQNLLNEGACGIIKKQDDILNLQKEKVCL